MARLFGVRRSAAWGRRRPSQARRALIGLSPFLLFGLVLAADELPGIASAPQFAGSAVAAADIAPAGAAAATAAPVEAAGAGLRAATAPKPEEGTQLARLTGPGEAVPDAEAEVPVAEAARTPPAEASVAPELLRKVTTPEDRSREIDGWRTAPAGDGTSGTAPDERLAAAGSVVVPQPRWDGGGGAMLTVPVPQPKPATSAVPQAPVGGSEAVRAPLPKPRFRRLESSTEPSVEPSVDPDLRALAPAARPERSRGAGDARVVIHYPRGSAGDEARAVGGAVDARGLGRAELRRVGADVSQANVRYFHPQDRAAAEAVNRLLRRSGRSSQLKDFTHYEPAPSRGTVEVWLPG